MNENNEVCKEEGLPMENEAISHDMETAKSEQAVNKDELRAHPMFSYFAK